MFKKPTTFVIGAGCSHEYGLPLGDGLRTTIASLLRNVEQSRVRHKPTGRTIISASSTAKLRDNEFNDAVAAAAGDDWKAWFKTCQTMADGLAHASSIDRYLDIHRDDPIKVQIGKMAIGRSILKAEQRSSLMVDSRGHLQMPHISKAAGGPHWLNELLLRMQEGVRLDQFELILSNVTFICFNYDRNIEHYLYHAIRTLGNLTAGRASEVMQHLKIYHPYGSLGRLGWQSDAPDEIVEFGQPKNDPQDIIRIGANIRIFTETIEENDDIRCIREAMQSANRIVFAGFSFLQQNLDLVRPQSQSSARRIYATTFGESHHNKESANNAVYQILQGINSSGTYPFKMVMEDAKAGRFMADAGNLLSS